MTTRAQAANGAAGCSRTCAGIHCSAVARTSSQTAMAVSLATAKFQSIAPETDRASSTRATISAAQAARGHGRRDCAHLGSRPLAASTTPSCSRARP